MTVDTKTQVASITATPDASIKFLGNYGCHCVPKILFSSCIYAYIQLNLQNLKMNPLQKVITMNSLGHYKPSKVYTYALLTNLYLIYRYACM